MWRNDYNGRKQREKGKQRRRKLGGRREEEKTEREKEWEVGEEM